MKEKSYLKKDDPVSKQGCIKTSTFRNVLLYAKKEILLKRNRTGGINRTGSIEKGQILLRKTLINTEESYQTGFERERKSKSFPERVAKGLFQRTCS